MSVNESLNKGHPLEGWPYVLLTVSVLAAIGIGSAMLVIAAEGRDRTNRETKAVEVSTAETIAKLEAEIEQLRVRNAQQYGEITVLKDKQNLANKAIQRQEEKIDQLSIDTSVELSEIQEAYKAVLESLKALKENK